MIPDIRIVFGDGRTAVVELDIQELAFLVHCASIATNSLDPRTFGILNQADKLRLSRILSDYQTAIDKNDADEEKAGF